MRSLNRNRKYGTADEAVKSLPSIAAFPIYLLSPGQTGSQVDASQRKFAKPELAYGLAMGGQTDSIVSKKP